MLGGQVGEARERYTQVLARLARTDVGFGDAASGEHIARQDNAALAGVVAESAEVPDERMGDTEVTRGIARLDRASAVEDHRGELVERGCGLAGVALEGRHIGHWIV